MASWRQSSGRDHPQLRGPHQDKKTALRPRVMRPSRDERRMPDRRDRQTFSRFSGAARGDLLRRRCRSSRFIFFRKQRRSKMSQPRSSLVRSRILFTPWLRLLLQKPERYHVRVKTKEVRPLFRLGESNAVSTNRSALEDSAFRLMRERSIETKVTLNDPIKGDFNSVARERTTGTLLGPTNHHSYQPQLRRFYEQRFSRRMSFLDFQRRSKTSAIQRWSSNGRKKRARRPRLSLARKNRLRLSTRRLRRNAIFARNICRLSLLRHRKRRSTASPVDACRTAESHV